MTQPKLTASLAQDFSPSPHPCTQSGPGGSENTTDWLEEVLSFKEVLVSFLNVSQLSSPYWEETDGIGNWSEN